MVCFTHPTGDRPVGFLVHAAGFNAGFLALAAIAVAGLVFFAAAMPETRDMQESLATASPPVPAPSVERIAPSTLGSGA
jgi:hypothetical protein